MMQRDYVMRLIEQFVEALVMIMKARQAENFEEAFDHIQKASHRYLCGDILTFLKMSPQQLLAHFKEKDKYLDVEQAIVCAELLYETAAVCKSKQREDLSLHAKILSLHLFLAAIPLDKQFQTQAYFDKVKALRTDLKAEELPEIPSEFILDYEKAKL